MGECLREGSSVGQSGGQNGERAPSMRLEGGCLSESSFASLSYCAAIVLFHFEVLCFARE